MNEHRQWLFKTCTRNLREIIHWSQDPRQILTRCKEDYEPNVAYAAAFGEAQARLELVDRIAHDLLDLLAEDGHVNTEDKG